MFHPDIDFYKRQIFLEFFAEYILLWSRKEYAFIKVVMVGDCYSGYDNGASITNVYWISSLSDISFI